MKVIDSNNFSKEEVKSFSQFYEKLVGPYRFKGKIKDSFYIADLIQAIDLLNNNLRKNVYYYLNGQKFDSNVFSAAIFQLRTVEFRAIYDSEVISSIRRATDYQSYTPSVVLGFVRLYDSFSGYHYDNTVSKEFTISDIEEILDVFPSYMSDVLYLHFGLLNGLPLSLKKVSKELNIPIETCKQLNRDALRILRDYC